MKRMVKKLKNIRVQAIWLGSLAMLLSLFSGPIQSNAFNIFNSDGYDGYFLSLTNDPTNMRVVPATVYDSHPKKQTSTSFVESDGVEVRYAQLKDNTTIKNVSKTGAEEDIKEKWLDSIKSGKNMKMGKHDKLAWTFPGFVGESVAKNYRASQTDLEQATWVSNTLVEDFNQAITMVYNTAKEYGNGKAPANLSNVEFANLIIDIANKAREAQNNGSSTLSYYGVTFKFEGGSKNKNVKAMTGLSKSNYITITPTKGKEITESITRSFIENVPKGYREGQKLYNKLSSDIQKNLVESGDEEVENLTWQHIALQSNANWAGKDVTFTNVGDITDPSSLEQYIVDMSSSALIGVRQMLGLSSSSDLILNNGSRGTNTYYKGIMPQSWMTSANILHWVSYALAWMLIIGAIAKLLVQRNIAAINPSERVDMINGIKNLMIVGFALSIFDVAFAGLANMNYLIVDMLSKTGVGIEGFGTAPMSSGYLASVIISVVFFIFDIYFNFFYIARGITIAILYAVGPLYVAAIAFGEKYRQIFSNYIKELVGNLFVQSFQAILVVFFAGITVFGNLKTIETMVLLFCFIPMTKFFKESIGASSSTTDALTGNALGAGAGLAAGIISSQFGKGGKKSKGSGNNATSDNNIKTKSGSDFSSVGGGVQKSKVGSLIGFTAKNGLKAGWNVGRATVGAGLVAGGAATGMKGASQLGGYMVGKGIGNIQDVAKDSIGGAYNNAIVPSAKKVKDWGSNFIDKKEHLKEKFGIADEEGNPLPDKVKQLVDGSTLQSFNKNNFSQSTGITSMQDIDNLGNTMKIGTSFDTKTGKFVGGSDELNNSEYARKFRIMANAFQSNSPSVKTYKEKGIMGMQVDPTTGMASFVVNKKSAGVGDIFTSGNNIHIQKMKRSNKNEKVHTNPFSTIIQ